MADKTYDSLTLLGGEAQVPTSPEEAILEAGPNPHPGALYLVIDRLGVVTLVARFLAQLT